MSLLTLHDEFEKPLVEGLVLKFDRARMAIHAA